MSYHKFIIYPNMLEGQFTIVIFISEPGVSYVTIYTTYQLLLFLIIANISLQVQINMYGYYLNEESIYTYYTLSCFLFFFPFSLDTLSHCSPSTPVHLTAHQQSPSLNLSASLYIPCLILNTIKEILYKHLNHISVIITPKSH